jgi:nicotinate-nucleotide pyrophosphorylase (carboxylating)
VRVTWRKRDGDALTKGEAFAEAQGSARSLLLAERVALNFMQRMSGVATATARMVAEVDRGAAAAAAGEDVGAPTTARRCRVLETRKTAPGLRLFDKWAVLIGGGSNHRMGLFDMVMVKDNHIAAAGGIAKAVAAVAEFLRGEAGKAAAQRLAEARGGAGGEAASSTAAAQIPVEVEVRTLDEVDELLAVLRAAGGGDGGSGSGGEVVTRVMLDNMVRRLSQEEAEARGGGGEGAEADAAAAGTAAAPSPLLPLPLRELERSARVDCSLLRAAVARLSREFPHLETEASGNVTEQTAAAVASTGVAFVSVGALTHSVAALDVSFNIET